MTDGCWTKLDDSSSMMDDYSTKLAADWGLVVRAGQVAMVVSVGTAALAVLAGRVETVAREFVRQYSRR
jgi:hypothetical protein